RAELMNPTASSSGVVCALPTTNEPAPSTMKVSVIVPPASIASTRGLRSSSGIGGESKSASLDRGGAARMRGRMEASQPPPPRPPDRLQYDLTPSRRPPYQPRGVQVGRVINEMFSIYGANIAPLLATAAIVFIVAGALQELLARGGLALVLLGSVVNLAATA